MVVITRVRARPGVALAKAVAVIGAGSLMAAGSAGSAGAVGARSAKADVTCQALTVPVALTPAQPAVYSVWGELCAAPPGPQPGATVQLLVPGATYNHNYWDFGPVDGVGDSYAREVAAAGLPTFAFDRIGTGRSSHPSSTDITVQVAAFVTHQLVTRLRHGGIGGTRFAKVIEVGHSYGSIATIEEAATYHDVSGVILTGDVHGSTVFAASAAADLYPAVDDPKFAGSGLDDGYLTTKPGTRGLLFYNPADADPAVIAADEMGKDVISATEFISGIPPGTSTLSRQIDVPVLLIDGSDDQINCGLQTTGGSYDCSSGRAIAAQEAPFFAPAAHLRACVVPGSGHDISLALNHFRQEADAIIWSYEYVAHGPAGTRGPHPLPPDCS